MILLDWFVSTAHAAAAADPSVISLPPVDIFPSSGPPGPELIANKIAGLLIALAWPLGFAAILATAYLLINSSGKPDAIEKAKKNIINLVIGFGLIIFTVLILRFVIGLLASNPA